MSIPELSTRHRLTEAFAVVSSLLYTFLYIKGQPVCWAFAFAGSAAFAYLCYVRNILAESVLQGFYVLMAVYGYFNMGKEWESVVWPMRTHLLWLVLATFGTIVCGFYLKFRTTSAMPFEDAFTTVFSIVATWAMVNFVHENYLYWMVIDAVSVHLYWKRGLRIGSALFFVYLIMVTLAYFNLM